MGFASGGSSGGAGGGKNPILGSMFTQGNKTFSMFSKFPLIQGLLNPKGQTKSPTLGQSDPAQNKFTSMLGG